jgi:hypothetical protein
MEGKIKTAEDINIVPTIPFEEPTKQKSNKNGNINSCLI